MGKLPWDPSDVSMRMCYHAQCMMTLGNGKVNNWPITTLLRSIDFPFFPSPAFALILPKFEG
jgi:hypothetical protein